jgi:hypothetical protein
MGTQQPRNPKAQGIRGSVGSQFDVNPSATAASCTLKAYGRKPKDARGSPTARITAPPPPSMGQRHRKNNNRFSEPRGNTPCSTVRSAHTRLPQQLTQPLAHYKCEQDVAILDLFTYCRQDVQPPRAAHDILSGLATPHRSNHLTHGGATTQRLVAIPRGSPCASSSA